MGTDDKVDNKAEDLRGKAKEAVGKATGDEPGGRGRPRPAQGRAEAGGEKVKDAFKKD